MAIKTFQKYLDENRLDDIKIIISEQPTNTAISAAQAHNVPVSNIIKSLLVTDEDKYFLILVPGDKKMDFKYLSEHLRTDSLRMTTPDEAKKISGYSIGGIPPFGHDKKSPTYIYEGFDKNEVLVGAAGSSNSVFKIKYPKLINITSAIELS